MQGICSTLLIDILYFMLAWSCRAAGGEGKAMDVHSAVQLGKLLFCKCSAINKNYEGYLREYMLAFGDGTCLMWCLRTDVNQKKNKFRFPTKVCERKERKMNNLLSCQKMRCPIL